MAIKKQAFYEGAALHLLARTGELESICYDAPFFSLNDSVLLYLKYSTKIRSPWGFTFTPDEQVTLMQRGASDRIVIGLVCGSDGVARVDYGSFARIAKIRKSAIHVACFRRHGKHYEVSGPDGTLAGKVAPSDWLRLFDN